MLKKSYKILKYIYKNPNISKSELLRKFPDFEIYAQCVSAYVYKIDNNQNIVRDIEDQTCFEMANKGYNLSEISDYISKSASNMQNITDSNLITYSTNFKFEDYFEKRKHEKWFFWLPYSITTFIAIISLIVQIFG